jgi:hypothetical protein
MKKIILFFLLAGITVSALAQNQLGFFAGPQMTSAKYGIYTKKQPTTAKYGFQAGATLKVPFDVNLFFAPAVYYSMKGYKVEYNRKAFPPDTTAIDNNTTIHTLELAFLLQYDLNGGKANHCYVKFGPSLDFQLIGNEKYNLKNGTSVSRSMPFNFGAYGHYSASMILQFGYEMASGLFFFGQYSHGLASINNADGGPSIKHRVFGLSIGKYINRKKAVINTANKE